MQRSTDRIRTTHVGSLARPPALLDLMKAAAAGKHVDPAELAGAERDRPDPPWRTRRTASPVSMRSSAKPSNMPVLYRARPALTRAGAS